MGKPVEFTLRNEAMNTDFGKVVFNGKFLFILDDHITPETWNAVGFIPLKDNSRQVESNDLFYYLNSRLPINLREKATKEKLDYIERTGLRVASDSFVLKKEPLKDSLQ